jgi:hypothetical protein
MRVVASRRVRLALRTSLRDTRSRVSTDAESGGISLPH